jgi:ionotropic glutamate receptor NMDA 2B
VTVEGGFGKPDIAFSSDGTLKSVELKIMNLRPGISSNLVWEVVSSLKLLSL